MIELDNDNPLLWCLNAPDTDGLRAVSLIVPCLEADIQKTVTIETSVMGRGSSDEDDDEEELMAWNEEDVELFLDILNQQRRLRGLPINETLCVDLNDPETIEIIHVIAAAGFGAIYMSNEIVPEGLETQPGFYCSIGCRVALPTIDGFKSCVVVDLGDEDAICVLLEDVAHLERHDLLLVSRCCLQHPGFAQDYALPAPASLH